MRSRSFPFAGVAVVITMLSASALNARAAEVCLNVFQAQGNFAGPALNQIQKAGSGVQLEPLPIGEILKRIPEVDYQDPLRRSEVANLVAAKIGVSKEQLDSWMNVFIDSGLIGGLDHVSSLITAGEKSETLSWVSDMYDRRAPDLTKRGVATLFAPYKGESPSSREARDRKAIAMAKRSLHGQQDGEAKESDVRLKERSQQKDKILNTLNKDPRSETLLAVLYRSTLADAMRATEKASKYSWTRYLGKGDRAFMGVLASAGFVFAAGPIGYFSSLLPGAEIPLFLMGGTGVGMANAILENINVYQAIRAQTEKREKKRLAKYMAPLKATLSEMPDVHSQVIRLEELGQFQLDEKLKPLSSTLQLEVYRDQFYETLTQVNEPIEIRSAVRRGLIIGKLAHDTNELILERIGQIQIKADTVSNYLEGRSSPKDLETQMKIEDVIQNIDDHAFAAGSELKFAIEALFSVITEFRRYEQVLTKSGTDESATLEKIRYFREHFEGKLAKQKEQSEAIIAKTRERIDALDRAYVEGDNRLRSIGD